MSWLRALNKISHHMPLTRPKLKRRNALSCTALCKAYALLQQISESLLYQKKGEFPKMTMDKCLRTSWMRCSVQPKPTLLIHWKMLTDNGHKGGFGWSGFYFSGWCYTAMSATLSAWERVEPAKINRAKYDINKFLPYKRETYSNVTTGCSQQIIQHLRIFMWKAYCLP